MKRTKKGFTIVELVIVIAVVAILAAVLIPTFASLIEKANESVDIQLVRQMNTILKTEEAANGKPANIEAVKAVLADNGFENPQPAMAKSAFAWHNEDNVIILLDKETQKGIFPAEYKDAAYDSTKWIIFGGTVNVSLEDLGAANLDEALTKVEPGQTIVLSSDQELNTTLLTENVSIDLNGKTVTAPSGFDLAANTIVTISNGNLTGKRVDLNDGAELTLNNVKLTGTSSAAFYPKGSATQLNINGGTILTSTIVTTSYSDGGSQHSIININGATFGSADAPCGVAFSIINSGDVRISNSTIYATEAAVISRAGNTTIENTTIHYDPAADFNATFLTNPGSSDYGIYTPNGNAGMCWAGGSGGMKAPIVIGDFYAKHYSVDANCTIKNVTVNSTNDTYPDVYLSQENYDVLAWDAANGQYADAVVAGTEQIVKTTLTCDSSVSWMVNPGDSSSYESICTGIYTKFAEGNYCGFLSQVTNGALLLYVDNVFVNGVEQTAGAKSN